MPTTIISFFDVTNKEHLIAYRYLERHGYWPEGFLPHGIEMTNLWQVVLASRLANAYITEKLGE